MNVPEIEQLAQRKAVTDMYRLSVRTNWATWPAAWVSVAFAWDYAPHELSLEWALGMSIYAVFRYICSSRRRASPRFLEDADKSARYHAWLVTGNALGFIAGFMLLAWHSPIEIVYGFSSLSIAMAAGATIVFATHLPSFVGYAVPILSTPVVLLLYSGYQRHSPGTVILGVAGVLYIGLLFSIYLYMHRVLMQNYRLQIEKDHFLEKLEHDNQELAVDRAAYLAASLTDKLTNLPNRRHFDIQIQREWERAYREATPIACIMLDIDHFKIVNDQYGHHRGDEYLCRLANQLSQTLNRSSDFLARYGGEEFVVILPNTNIQGAVVIAEQLRLAVASLAIESPLSASDIVTISAGVSAQAPKSSQGNAWILVELADAALYRAKRGGRNQVVSSSIN